MDKCFKSMIRVFFNIMTAIMLFIFPATVFASAAPESVNNMEAAEIPSRIIITDYFIEGGGLVAGETNSAVFVLRNTSMSSKVTSVLLTGWIDNEAPAEFDSTNQIYVPSIPPGGESSVEIKIYTNAVDLTSINSIAAGFTVSYNDEESQIMRSDDVCVRLPVLHVPSAIIDEANLLWQAPALSAIDKFLNAKYTQTLCITGLIVCSIGSIIKLLIMFKKLRFQR